MMDTDESIRFCIIEIVRTGSKRGIKSGERGIRFDSRGLPLWSQAIAVIENFVYDSNVEEYYRLEKPIPLTDGGWLTHYSALESGSVFVRIRPTARSPGNSPAAV